LKETVLSNKIEESTHKFYSALNMQTSTRCIKSINVRSKLIKTDIKFSAHDIQSQII